MQVIGVLINKFDFRSMQIPWLLMKGKLCRVMFTKSVRYLGLYLNSSANYWFYKRYPYFQNQILKIDRYVFAKKWYLLPSSQIMSIHDINTRYQFTISSNDCACILKWYCTGSIHLSVQEQLVPTRISQHLWMLSSCRYCIRVLLGYLNEF